MRSIIYASLSVLALATFGEASAVPGADLNARALPNLEARAPTPVVEARSPKPSRRSTKRTQEKLTPEDHFSIHLCPFEMSVCPLPSTDAVTTKAPVTLLGWIADGFECVDFGYDLTSCGGCGSLDVRYDCTSIPHALPGVSCSVGKCKVTGCEAGYRLATDGASCIGA